MAGGTSCAERVLDSETAEPSTPSPVPNDLVQQLPVSMSSMRYCHGRASQCQSRRDSCLHPVTKLSRTVYLSACRQRAA